ncbi:MAG: PilT-related nuclease/ATPase with N-terminal rane domain, partial [Verrucomicrobiaceae bacterium]|nr:PilT-related nuclease/ATPase with N-terminal rane domain [Verrucomicrobiaceae bacterium]
MRASWSIRVVRILFVVLCLFLGSVIALGFGRSGWLGALYGLPFGGLIVLLDASLGSFSMRHFSYAIFGLLIGLFGAFLVTRVGVFNLVYFQFLPDGEAIRNAVEIAIYATLGFLGVTLALRSDRDQLAFIIPYVRFRRDASEGEPLLLDTNIVIDGRIPRLFQTGFLSGTLVIPRLVLDELQRMADSQDPIKAERGKHGLHVMEQMRAIRDLDLTIHEDGSHDSVPVDTRLVSLARELNARLLTNDENLAQVARLRGIQVLSLNELSRALQSEL